ncbi:uncharacterized protein [Anabrus simplex]|uniref:uncharacterized protein n=1 Tax=Anabrus simplex TaxID=316456 RepID=UPI0035A37251
MTDCDTMKQIITGEVLWGVALWILVLRGAVAGLRNVRLVLPPVVRAGTSTTLLCQFDMEGAPLYSVTWYRGTRAFYRFVPRNRPPKQVFPFPGISVDVESSSEYQVSLRRVPLHLAGAFSCEVSADAPSFTTVTVSDNLTVLEFPDTRPTVEIESDFYIEGEPLVVNCTTLPISFQSTLTFYVNNEAATSNLVTSWPGGATLRFTPQRYNFSRRGEMRLKCILSVMGQYHVSSRSVAIWLHTNTTEEFPVLAAAAVSCNHFLQLELNLFTICFLTVANSLDLL